MNQNITLCHSIFKLPLLSVSLVYVSVPLEYKLIFTAIWTREAEDEEAQILLPDG
jgi:hypothetical protein